MFQFDGYTFYAGKDSKYSDIYYHPDKNIIELKQICDKDDRCVAFNTYGYIKDNIVSPLQFVNIPNTNKKIVDGIYVNDKRYKEQFSHIEFSDYEFISGMDFYNYDITHEPNKNIYELKLLCDGDDTYMGFNTFGYVKYYIDKNKLVKISDTYRHGQGLYIKKTNRFKLLNTEPQNTLTLYNNIKGFCINLLRRPDRKEVMSQQFKNIDLPIEFYEAVDGKTLELTNEIKKILRNNDYNWRKSVVGCALSHYNLLKQLSMDEKYDKYLIFEDDVKLSPLFNKRLKNVLLEINNNPYYDIIFLGHHIPTGLRNDIAMSRNNDDTMVYRIKEFNEMKSFGGTFAYIITKNMATKAMEFLKNNSIVRAIDYFYIDSKYNFNMKVGEVIPHLAFSEYVDDGNKKDKIDSDIQRSNECFDVK